MAQTATSLTTIDPKDAAIAAEAATKGDLSKLSPEQRTQLYGATCRSMGLNPLSQPFQYLQLNNKLTLYATRTATDQLRKINHVSITGIETTVIEGVLMVTVHARDASGREDTEIGAVSIANLKGEALANAHMKAITKAKRRVTLSISGLGWLDETEVETIPNARPMGDVVDLETGEIHNPAPQQVLPDEPTWQRESNRLHAIANEHGISHDDLHNWAVANDFGSVKNMSTDDLMWLTASIEDDPDKAKRHLAKLRAQAPKSLRDDSEPIDVTPPTPEEMEAALAASTPVLPGVDVPEATTTDRFTR